MDMTMNVIMRTAAIEEAMSKWTNGETENIYSQIEKLNDIASEIYIEETKYSPDRLMKILEEMGEEYYILVDYWDSDLIPWTAYCTSGYGEAFNLRVTPTISLEIDEGY